MPMTQEEMVKLLKKYGFTLCKGGKGSHIKMNKPGQKRPIIIPKGELNKFTEKGILKDAGLLWSSSQLMRWYNVSKLSSNFLF